MANEKTFTIVCPHCNGEIAARLGLMDVEPWTKNDEPFDWRNTLTEKQIAIVEQASASGLLDHFADAVIAAKRNQIPKSMERFLITFFATAVAAQVPKHILNILIRYFEGRISVWISNGVAAILSDGEIKMFAPQAWLVGGTIRNIGGNVSGRTSANESEVADWIQTRFGLVAFKGAMFESMRVKSKGDFVTVRSQP